MAMYRSPFYCPYPNSKRLCIWLHKTSTSLRSGQVRNHICYGIDLPLPSSLPPLSDIQAAYREETVLLTVMYKTHPRLTFCYLYLFHYYTMFLPVVQSQLQARDRFWPDTEKSLGSEDDPILQTKVEEEAEGDLELEMLNSAKKPVFVRTYCLEYPKSVMLCLPHLFLCFAVDN